MATPSGDVPPSQQSTQLTFHSSHQNKKKSKNSKKKKSKKSKKSKKKKAKKSKKKVSPQSSAAALCVLLPLLGWVWVLLEACLSSFLPGIVLHLVWMALPSGLGLQWTNDPSQWLDLDEGIS